MLVMSVATFSLDRNFLAGLSLSAYRQPMKARNEQLALVVIVGLGRLEKSLLVMDEVTEVTEVTKKYSWKILRGVEFRNGIPH